MYAFGTEAARAGYLTAIRSPRKTYGYAIKNTSTGDVAMWFRYKRDAVRKIHALATCPNYKGERYEP